MRLRFWRKPPAPGYRTLPGWPAAAALPGSLADDLRRHLYASMYAVGPGARRQSRWVMFPEWLTEVRKLDYAPPVVLGSPERLLGLPLEVREGSGPPHLELVP